MSERGCGRTEIKGARGRDDVTGVGVEGRLGGGGTCAGGPGLIGSGPACSRVSPRMGEGVRGPAHRQVHEHLPEAEQPGQSEVAQASACDDHRRPEDEDEDDHSARNRDIATCAEVHEQGEEGREESGEERAYGFRPSGHGPSSQVAPTFYSM